MGSRLVGSRLEVVARVLEARVVYKVETTVGTF